MTTKVLCVPFRQLSIHQLYEVLRLRSEVFVVEQTCIYQDMDNKDIEDGVHHLLLFKNEQLAGYARLLPKNISFDTPSIGRILVAVNHRSCGLGRELINHCIEQTLRLWPAEPITIGAQSHLLKLYIEFGFVEISADYLEDGIPHVDMRLDPAD
jgi:ElaA protein